MVSGVAGRRIDEVRDLTRTCVRSAFLAVLGLAVGCSRRETPAAPPVAEPLRIDASVPVASASASASAPAASASAPPPLPPAPPGTDPEEVRLLGAICRAAVAPPRPGAPGKRRVGCRAHPPFDTPDKQPDGTLPTFTGEPNELCVLARVVHGAFSRPGAKESLLVFDACVDGDLAWDMASPGSVVLVEESTGRARVVATERAVYADDCEPVKRKDGREVLVCRYAFTAPPSGMVHQAFVLDLAGRAPTKTPLATLFTDTLSCSQPGSPPPDLSAGLTFSDVTRFARRDLDGDGLVDLEMTVSRAHVAPSPALTQRIEGACRKGTAASDARPYLPPPTTTKLVFRNDGSALVPSPETTRTLDRWTSESPSGFNGLPH